MMRHLPYTLALLFIGITLTRVADLAANELGAGILGWAFALGLGAGVYGSSYWTKAADDRLRRAAGWTLGFFVVCDLVFNGAEVYQHMRRTGALADVVLMLAGVFYAVFPTVAAGLLGWLQGHVDRQPKPIQRTPFWRRIRLALYAGLDRALPQADAESFRDDQKLSAGSGKFLDGDADHKKLSEQNTDQTRGAESFLAWPRDWRKLSEAQRAQLPTMTDDEIIARTGLTPRGVLNWRIRARDAASGRVNAL